MHFTLANAATGRYRFPALTGKTGTTAAGAIVRLGGRGGRGRKRKTARLLARAGAARSADAGRAGLKKGLESQANEHGTR